MPVFGTQNLSLFIVAGLLLNMAPGPDSLLVVTRSATQGWRGGSAAALGVGAGTFVHVFSAALGLSAILATSATAFGIVKYLGAAYLLYVGIGLLRSRTADRSPSAAAAAPVPAPTPLPYRKIFAQGLLTNVLNPKVAVFFLAFVPQFIAPDAANKPLAFVVLGCIFNVGGVLWCHGLAVTTALASRRLQIDRGIAVWLDRLVGAVFVSLGVKLALTERP